MPIRVTPEQAARFLRTPKAYRRGKPRVRTDATLRADRRERPEAHEHDLLHADNHHLSRPCPCPGCGEPTTHFVQLRGLSGPVSVTLPECVPCARVRLAQAKAPGRGRPGPPP